MYSLIEPDKKTLLLEVIYIFSSFFLELEVTLEEILFNVTLKSVWLNWFILIEFVGWRYGLGFEFSNTSFILTYEPVNSPV